MRGHIDYKVTAHVMRVCPEKISAWSDEMVVVDGIRFEVTESELEITALLNLVSQSEA